MTDYNFQASMTRIEMTEQFRRLRQAEGREPVENAVLALTALCAEDRTKAITRFNSIFAKNQSVPTLSQAPKTKT